MSPSEFSDELTRCYEKLWTIAVAVCGDRWGAEDVVQDAAIAALGQLERFEDGTRFDAWMGQFVRWTALNHRRRETPRRSPVDPGPIIDGLSTSDGADDELVDASGRLDPDQRSFDDELLDALQSVDEVRRSCLLLRVLRGCTYAEIAAVLGIPEGTAMSHVHRTKQTIRERLDARQYPRLQAREGEP